MRSPRQEETAYIHNKEVLTVMKRDEAHRRGWKIRRTGSIDINKGGLEGPCYRSRFVDKEFNDSVADGLFAVTPPLEGLRMLVSDGRPKGRGPARVIDDTRCNQELSLRLRRRGRCSSNCPKEKKQAKTKSDSSASASTARETRPRITRGM